MNMKTGRPEITLQPIKELDNDKLYYTIYEVAEIYGVHHNTIRRLLKSGKLQGEQIGRQWRISKTVLKTL